MSSEWSVNLLPTEGEVIYLSMAFSECEKKTLFQRLIDEIPWQHDQTRMYGKIITTKRKVAWYADEGRPYSYSGTIKKANVWSQLLNELKNRAEDLSQETYNSCLCNLYHDGTEGMSWHADNENSLVAGAAIFSFSFGAERKFSFRHKQTHDRVSIQLEDGSALIMKGETQSAWHHQLPKTVKVKLPRVNLTFRKMK